MCSQLTVQNQPRRQALELNDSQFAANVVPMVRHLQRVSIVTLPAIADALNARGVKTSRPNGKWYHTTVKNVLARA